MPMDEITVYYMVNKIAYLDGSKKKLACCLKAFRAPLEKDDPRLDLRP